MQLCNCTRSVYIFCLLQASVTGFAVPNALPSHLSFQVLKKFRVIFGSVRHHFRQVEASCGISGSQLWLLQEVIRMPGIGVSELATRLSIHQSTCSQLVEKLSSRGLLSKERSQEDQRRVGLQPTATARELLGVAPGPVEGVLPDALMALSEHDLAELDVQLSKVIAQLHTRDDGYAEKPLSDL